MADSLFSLLGISARKHVNYSLYLVTDSTSEILGGRDLCSVVDSALKGGVSIVQYRDKTSDTAELIRVASKLHRITLEYKVPLLINDRVDVALAVGAEGVHLGQDDMSISTARRILGKNSIIGATTASPEEANQAIKDGADYLGLGTVYATSTKQNAKSIIGVAGLRNIIASLEHSIPVVCIGGINISNASRMLCQSCNRSPMLACPQRGCSGVAVVSAIIGSDSPEVSARSLRDAIDDILLSPRPEYKGFGFIDSTERSAPIPSMLSLVPPLLRQVAENKPLAHNMTNLVVTNFAANMALALGASPIMSNNGEEAADLAALGGSLVVNMGTVTPEALRNYLLAIQQYNIHGLPILLDPVGGGATAIRRDAVRQILDSGYFDIMKGNESEIRTLYNVGTGSYSKQRDSQVAQHGVDSTSTLSHMEKASLVRDLALREGNTVVMTGPIDYVSNGKRAFAIKNGHRYLGEITGSGCTLGTCIAAFAASVSRVQRSGVEVMCVPELKVPSFSKILEHGDGMLLAVLAGILTFEMAAEMAVDLSAEEMRVNHITSGDMLAERVNGPGSFVPAFLDAVAELRKRAMQDPPDFKWIDKALVEEVHVS